jgi:hypothetical protein
MQGTVFTRHLSFTLPNHHGWPYLLIVVMHLQPSDKYRGAYTALRYAAGKGHTEVVRVLLKHGADIEARCKVQYSHGIYHSPYPTTTADHIHPFHVLFRDTSSVSEVFSYTASRGCQRGPCTSGTRSAGAWGWYWGNALCTVFTHPLFTVPNHHSLQGLFRDASVDVLQTNTASFRCHKGRCRHGSCSAWAWGRHWGELQGTVFTRHLSFTVPNHHGWPYPPIPCLIPWCIFSITEPTRHFTRLLLRATQKWYVFCLSMGQTVRQDARYSIHTTSIIHRTQPPRLTISTHSMFNSVSVSVVTGIQYKSYTPLQWAAVSRKNDLIQLLQEAHENHLKRSCLKNSSSETQWSMNVYARRCGEACTHSTRTLCSIRLCVYVRLFWCIAMLQGATRYTTWGIALVKSSPRFRNSSITLTLTEWLHSKKEYWYYA